MAAKMPTDPDGKWHATINRGTFDQGGDLWEYLESRHGNQVGLRGGSFFLNDNPGYMESTTRYDVYTAKWPNYGFRVVSLGGK